MRWMNGRRWMEVYRRRESTTNPTGCGIGRRCSKAMVCCGHDLTSIALQIQWRTRKARARPVSDFGNQWQSMSAFGTSYCNVTWNPYLTLLKDCIPNTLGCWTDANTRPVPVVDLHPITRYHLLWATTCYITTRVLSAFFCMICIFSLIHYSCYAWQSMIVLRASLRPSLHQSDLSLDMGHRQICMCNDVMCSY